MPPAIGTSSVVEVSQVSLNLIQDTLLSFQTAIYVGAAVGGALVAIIIALSVYIYTTDKKNNSRQHEVFFQRLHEADDRCRQCAEDRNRKRDYLLKDQRDSMTSAIQDMRKEFNTHLSNIRTLIAGVNNRMDKQYN
jgi:CHASE3 domain sensor protein